MKKNSKIITVFFLVVSVLTGNDMPAQKLDEAEIAITGRI
jgi:hypothetical protein